MQDILYWIGDHWIQVGLIASFVIQITPIKWNPWSSLVSWIGRTLTRDVTKKIDEVSDKLDQVEKEQARQDREHKIDEMDYIRTTVLDFANSCRQKRRHTKEEFDHVFALNDKYQELLKTTGQQNGRFEEAFDYIRDLYRRCMEENDFLA